MSYAQISNIIPQYENYANYWLKAYEQGTTTPKVMGLDSAGASTVAKLELNANGFPVTSGSALVIPYIDGAFDLFLFPTEAEADANDTGSAIQVADNINIDAWSVYSDSEGIAYLPPYTGGVSTTVEAKLSQVVSALDFAAGDGVTDDTAAIQAAYNSGASEVTFPDGTYLVTEDTITIPDGVSTTGSGTIKCNASSAASTNSHSKAMLIVTTNNSVSGLKFLGSGNNCYGVGGFSDATHDCDNILIENVTATECGIFCAEPFDGFSFNRYDEAFIDWYNSGQVTSAHKGQDITVKDCVMYGDTTYSAATTNTNSAKVSGVQLFFCENAVVSNIKTYNSRFGAWSYGGSPKNAANTDLNSNTNEAKNIRFEKIIAKDVYSCAWMSKTDDGIITNCEASNFEDVQIDFEGCSNCIGSENVVKTTGVAGQALGALNGCDSVIFSNNIIQTGKSASVILCRDGNSNIVYKNNILKSTHGSTAASIKVWNALSGLTTNNSNIEISGNRMDFFDIDAQIVEGISIESNRFYGASRSLVIATTDCDKVYIDSNKVNFTTDYTDATAAGSPIQVLEGGGTIDHTDTIVTNNKVLDCTAKSGIYIQIALTASPLNSVRVTDNVANCIWAADSWINTPVNGTKGRFIDSGNTSTLLDTDHVLASVISRSGGVEKFNPSIMYGGTGVGSLTGTFKVGDIIYRTTPTASGTIGWVCTTAGTPGTWKTFGSIAA